MKRKSLAILLIASLLFSGCVEQPADESAQESEKASLEESEIVPILLQDKDFNDWRNDFIEYQGKEPQLRLIELTRLSPEKVQEMIESSQPGVRPVTEQILSGLPVETGNIFYVRMRDRVVRHKGIIAIIDAKEKKVIRFFATLDISA